MSVTIQDDMWAAAQQLPGRDGQKYLAALIRYGMTGEEPWEGESWYPLFTVTKDRIDMSKKKRERAKKMNEARWGKKDNPQGASTRSIHKDIHKDDAEVSRDEMSRGKGRKNPYEVDSKVVAL